MTRGYYAEGEFQPGSPAQYAYYGIDQLGSVRRVFTSGTAPAYDYDAYGSALQSTATLTDYGYAGMFGNADSGLYLTMFRAYDPVSGRWLSRDPIGETRDSDGNLYAYVGGNPISFVDPLGLLALGDSLPFDPPDPAGSVCESSDSLPLIAATGERGWAGSPNGTDNPFKHMKPHPTDPDKVIYKDPQTGKK